MTPARPINYFRHVRDEDRCSVYPEESARRLQRIIAAATCHPAGMEVATGTRCGELGAVTGCSGRLRLRWEDGWPPVIHWSCATCGEQRSMWGWDESEFDRRACPAVGAGDGVMSILVSHETYDVLADKLPNESDERLVHLGRAGVLDPESPARVIVRGTLAEIEEAMACICSLADICAIQDPARIVAAWRQLDEAVAAGRPDRHDERDERIRREMRAFAKGERTGEPYIFPEILNGYMLVQPERGRALRNEFYALDFRALGYPEPEPINFWKVATDDLEDPNTETRRLTWIVGVATCHPPGVDIASGARCDGPRSPRGCDGRLRVRWDASSPPTVRWACPTCGDAGSVQGWDAAGIDGRKLTPIGARVSGELVISLSIAEYDTLVRSVYESAEGPAQRFRNGAVLDPSDPSHVIVRATVDEIEHALDYICGESITNHRPEHQEPFIELWHRLDAEIVAAGYADRHDRRDERVRSYIRINLARRGTLQPWGFPEFFEGYAIFQPERAAVLRAEWEALRAEGLR